MKNSFFKRILLLTVFSLYSLEANELFFLNIKTNIDLKLTKDLDFKYEAYKNKVEENKKNLVNTLVFSSLIRKETYLFENEVKKDLKSELKIK